MRSPNKHPGQSLIEFAITLPLIMVLVVAFADLGRVLYFYAALNNSVREGARFASVHQFSTSTERELMVQQRVVQFTIASSLEISDVSLHCDLSEADMENPCDDYITVSAGITIVPIAPFLTEMIGLGSDYNITAQSTMQMSPFGKYH